MSALLRRRGALAEVAYQHSQGVLELGAVAVARLDECCSDARSNAKQVLQLAVAPYRKSPAVGLPGEVTGGPRLTAQCAWSPLYSRWLPP